MLTGRVSLDLQAWLSVEILDADGQSHLVEVVLDTGFEGELALPSRIIRQLGLAAAGRRWMELSLLTLCLSPRQLTGALTGRRLCCIILPYGFGVHL